MLRRWLSTHNYMGTSIWKRSKHIMCYKKSYLIVNRATINQCWSYTCPCRCRPRWNSFGEDLQLPQWARLLFLLIFNLSMRKTTDLVPLQFSISVIAGIATIWMLGARIDSVMHPAFGWLLLQLMVKSYCTRFQLTMSHHMLQYCNHFLFYSYDFVKNKKILLNKKKN